MPITLAQAGALSLVVSGGGQVTGNGGGIQFTASGGTGPYTFELLAGRVPPGTTFQSDGRIGGIATARGASLIRVRATDLGALPQAFVDSDQTVTIS